MKEANKMEEDEKMIQALLESIEREERRYPVRL